MATLCVYSRTPRLVSGFGLGSTFRHLPHQHHPPHRLNHGPQRLYHCHHANTPRRRTDGRLSLPRSVSTTLLPVSSYKTCFERFPLEDYVERRRRLASALPPRSLAVVAASTEIIMSNDIPYRFRQVSSINSCTRAERRREGETRAPFVQRQQSQSCMFLAMSHLTYRQAGAVPCRPLRTSFIRLIVLSRLIGFAQFLYLLSFIILYIKVVRTKNCSSRWRKRELPSTSDYSLSLTQNRSSSHSYCHTLSCLSRIYLLHIPSAISHLTSHCSFSTKLTITQYAPLSHKNSSHTLTFSYPQLSLTPLAVLRALYRSLTRTPSKLGLGLFVPHWF